MYVRQSVQSMLHYDKKVNLTTKEGEDLGTRLNETTYQCMRARGGDVRGRHRLLLSAGGTGYRDKS